MVATFVRLVCIGTLGWALFLTATLLRMSLMEFDLLPKPYLSDILLSLSWPLSFVPAIWLALMIFSSRYPKLKACVDHHLFIPSLTAVSLTIAFSFSVAAALPWMPIISKLVK